MAGAAAFSPRQSESRAGSTLPARRISKANSMTAYERLLAAVMTSAFRTISDLWQPDGSIADFVGAWLRARRAALWIMSESREQVFSYRTICDELDLPPEKGRAQLRELDAKLGGRLLDGSPLQDMAGPERRAAPAIAPPARAGAGFLAFPAPVDSPGYVA